MGIYRYALMSVRICPGVNVRFCVKIKIIKKESYMICDTYKNLLETVGQEKALEYLLCAQPDPQHVRSLLQWVRRFIECGHVVTAGYSFIGPVKQKDKKTGLWEVIKEHGKVGTHSGYLKGWFRNHDKDYYGWLPNQIFLPWTMKDFSPAAMWLMLKEWDIMRTNQFEFNSLYLHTNNMTILDLDIYKNLIPRITLDWIISKIPQGTPCCLSQAGGRHYYFKPTDNVIGKPKLGIDILRNTGFVYAPPTRIRGGGSYSFENIHSPKDFPKELPELPPALKAFFGTPEPVKRATPIVHRDSFSTKQIEILVKRLEEADKSDDRSAGDFSAACWGATIGMSLDKFQEYASKYSKFADRGDKYLEATWNRALEAVK
jgi:hypothetical protein